MCSEFLSGLSRVHHREIRVRVETASLASLPPSSRQHKAARHSREDSRASLAVASCVRWQDTDSFRSPSTERQLPTLFHPVGPRSSQSKDNPNPKSCPIATLSSPS